MDKVLEGINHSFSMAILDDILVHSSTLTDRLVHVQEVLNYRNVPGLPLNSDKVQMCFQTRKFLGHAISHKRWKQYK